VSVDQCPTRRDTLGGCHLAYRLGHSSDLGPVRGAWGRDLDVQHTSYPGFNCSRTLLTDGGDSSFTLNRVAAYLPEMKTALRLPCTSRARADVPRHEDVEPAWWCSRIRRVLQRRTRTSTARRQARGAAAWTSHVKVRALSANAEDPVTGRADRCPSPGVSCHGRTS
jgi:hypothetical protein